MRDQSLSGVLAIIPARWGSTRLPGKALLDLAGKSLVRRVWERVSDSELFDRVLVATDDARILNHVHDFGGEALMTPSELPSGTDRCAYAARSLDSSPALIINVQGDEPLVDPLALADLIRCFDDPLVDIATLAVPFADDRLAADPNRVKVVCNARGNALYFSRLPIPHLRDHTGSSADMPAPYLRHLGIYAFRSDALDKVSKLPPCALERRESLEQLRWLWHGYSIQVVQTDRDSPGVDTAEDLQTLRRLLEGDLSGLDKPMRP